ncbi:MAG: hypothetical protein RXR52_39900, partial [Paraburkholderia sp.]
MKTTRLDQYYYGIARGLAVMAAGTGLLVTHGVYAAPADDVVRLAVAAGAPLPASGAPATTQLAQDDESATSPEAYAATAADDVAAIFQNPNRECRGDQSGNCVQHPRGGASGPGVSSAGANASGGAGPSSTGANAGTGSDSGGGGASAGGGGSNAGGKGGGSGNGGGSGGGGGGGGGG